MKSKQRPPEIKFFTVVGYARVERSIGNNIYSPVFKTRAKAAKFIANEVNVFIESEGIEGRPKETAKSCMNGACAYAYDDRLELNIVEHHVPADFFTK